MELDKNGSVPSEQVSIPNTAAVSWVAKIECSKILFILDFLMFFQVGERPQMVCNLFQLNMVIIELEFDRNL